jgi:hypothetical protein
VQAYKNKNDIIFFPTSSPTEPQMAFYKQKFTFFVTKILCKNLKMFFMLFQLLQQRISLACEQLSMLRMTLCSVMYILFRKNMH